jgi:hypothetical protein
MTSIKSITTKSKKFDMCEIIKSTYHIHLSGDFLHYAVFLPNAKDADYYEKGIYWNEHKS